MPNTHNTSWLQRWLESVWYDNGKGRFFLMPFSALYCAINHYQRKNQIAEREKRKRLPCPVIVVGNITVGGTGKTPLTIHIVKLLQSAGYKPAIITRGYGGKANTWPQSVTPESDASMVGDEAVLMASRTHVPVYAGANRLDSIKQLLQKHDCDVIVSDDGMQHYKLPRDIQIAVIDGKRQLGNGYCLPAGPLREKRARLSSCDFIVINGKIAEDKNAHKAYLVDSFDMGLLGDTLINISTAEEKPLSDFNECDVQALTGIGNPQRFYSTLEKYGLQLNKHSFPDHHAFQQSDLAFDLSSTVIMTEKDAVKCQALLKNEANYWYLPITAHLDTRFDTALLARLEACRN